MSTLQHISQGTLNWRFVVVAALVAALTVAALTIALVTSSGSTMSSPQSDAAPAAIAQQVPSGDPKYLATHRRPAPDAAAGGQSLRDDAVYLEKH